MRKYIKKFDGSWWIEREPDEEDQDPIELDTYEALKDLIKGRGEELGLLDPEVLGHVLYFEAGGSLWEGGAELPDDVLEAILNIEDLHILKFILSHLGRDWIRSLQQSQDERKRAILKRLMLHPNRDIRVRTIKALGSKPTP